jgi:uncharacterized membrane protein YhaH (DUF805 family)
MITAYKEFWRNYCNFSGFSTRSEFWFVVLVNMIISFVITTVIGAVSSSVAMVLSVLYAIASFIPFLALTVRRLHDSGRTGKRIFFIFIPVVGTILLIIWLASY